MQIKGTKSGLLLHLYDRPLAGAVLDLRGKLDASPDFYRGSRAVLMLGHEGAEAAELAAVVATLEQYGITADGAVCDSDASAAIARSAGLRLVAASVAAAPRKLDDRTTPSRNGRARRSQDAHEPAEPATNVYHKGTVRSGQSFESEGSLIVVGDVNAGAELIAGGDIIVWGALRGVAHAGARGDDAASVYALRLEATQLRISRCIAAAPPPDKKRAHDPIPEIATIRDGRIVIVRADQPHR
jgi:septum site-determining protein MinC